MSMDQILSDVRNYEGLLELWPEPGSEHPVQSWGDHFFYSALDGEVPGNRQPYATIITKNYPDDGRSHLDAEGRWRLNIHVGTRVFAELVGYPPANFDASRVDYSVDDVFLPHPLYGAYGWICVVNPEGTTVDHARMLLRGAHEDDRRRVERRARGTASSSIGYWRNDGP